MAFFKFSSSIFWSPAWSLCVDLRSSSGVIDVWLSWLLSGSKQEVPNSNELIVELDRLLFAVVPGSKYLVLGEAVLGILPEKAVEGLLSVPKAAVQVIV